MSEKDHSEKDENDPENQAGKGANVVKKKEKKRKGGKEEEEEEEEEQDSQDACAPGHKGG